jgi:iron uptake system EfeUOB component EfeO/EfeM
MKRNAKWLAITAALVLTLLLSACGGGNKIADGVKNMKEVLAEVKSSVDAGDAVKAKSDAAKLEEAWASFEDDVKDKSKDLYDKLETPLHVIEAGASVDPLDKDTLNKSIVELDQVLSEIEKL